MLIKYLINQLQVLYDTYDDEYKTVAGEPEIMVDVFAPVVGEPHKFYYAGFDHIITIEKSKDGVYDIVNKFKSS